MADYDSNLIKPVQSLQNIAGLAPAKRREERNNRRQSHEKDSEQDEFAEEAEVTAQEQAKDKGQKDGGRIDYCA
ncbi:MAG: hypothetical protein AMJ65_06330 [Phycisphaerae bacterium SG8_4]|nr:MAG: hypothetical protein AMJ65_06330 [Phycisphaerae bacterium SG8_4]